MVNPAPNSDVMDWVRRQAQHGIDNQQQQQQQQQAEAPPLPPPPIANDLLPHPAALQSQESGELFDSGTESGEDSTTQSNHSQSDLNSFMANLAKLSLEQHQPSQQQQQQQQQAIVPCAAESTIPAARDFLLQVDSVLDRLKTSLQPDDLAEFNAHAPMADHQEVLHQHLASGGLDKQWRIHPQQQSELIGLIDRLKTSLHHLQSTDNQPSAAAAVESTVVAAAAAPVVVVPVKTAVATPTVPSSPANKQIPGIKPVASAINEKVDNETKSYKVQTKQLNNNKPTTITVASPAGSVNSMTGITCVKLRAKTFTTAPVERPVSRPNSFLLNVSNDPSGERQINRLSWRSSSEPNTPVTSPSPTPTPSPLPPPKIHWRSPKDFLANNTTTTTAAVCRPVWCRDTSSSSSNSNNNNNNSSSSTPGKIKLLEKSGIRGRFVQPELNPAPVVTQKTPAPAVRLPSFSLNKVQQPASPPSHQQSRPQTPQTPQTPPAQVAAQGPFQQQPSRPLLLQKQQQQSKPTERPVQKQQQLTEKPVVQQKQTERPVVQLKQPTMEEIQKPIEKTVEKQPEEVVNSSGNRNKSKDNSNVPWKVKLAKKKAERSQTTTGMDGQVSVDLRKSIRMAAATRKSMEDVREVGNSTEPTTPAASFKLTSESAGYPLLKQKSLGELYAPRLPKPFTRSESVGAAGSLTMTPLNTPEINRSNSSSWVKKFNWSNNNSRSSSVDRMASDLSSAPQTPLSPDPPSPVVMAAGLMPSKSGHSWVLSMKAAAPPTKTAAVATPESPKVPQPVVQVEKTEGKETKKPMEQVKTVEKEPEESEDDEEEVEEVVTVGVLNLGAKDEQVKAPELTTTQLERQTSSDLKSDPSAGLFTPAETLQIAIHKAAIKASLSRQMSERNICEPLSPSVTDPESPMNKKTQQHPLAEVKPKKSSSSVVDAMKNLPQLIRAKTSPKLTPPPSAFNFKSATVTPPPPTTQPEAPKKAADPSPAVVALIDESAKESIDNEKKIAPVDPAEPPPLINPAIQKELQKAEQYIKAAMAPIPSWKERARRSNTVAFSSGPGSSWRPVQAPSQITIKTENDRKFQNLFQKNAESHSAGRSLPSDPSGGGMWTNKFSNIRSSFESRPTSTATTPTQSRSRRSSADDNPAAQVPSITAGHLQFQIKPELEKLAAAAAPQPSPPPPAIPPKMTKPTPQPEVKQSPKLPQKQFKPLPEVKEQPKSTKQVEPVKMKPAAKLPQPEEPKPASSINMRMIPTLPQSNYSNGSIRSSSVGGSSAHQLPSPSAIRKRPEENKEAEKVLKAWKGTKFKPPRAVKVSKESDTDSRDTEVRCHQRRKGTQEGVWQNATKGEGK